VSVVKSGFQSIAREIILFAIQFVAFFTFYFIFSIHVLPKVIGPSNVSLSLIQAFFSLTIAVTLLVLSFLKFKSIRTRTLLGTYIATFVFTILLLFVSGELIISIIVLLVAVFFSVGQLSFLASFWKKTLSEERGRIGGLIGFVTLPIYIILSIVVADNLDLSGTVILAAALSLVPLLVALFRNKSALAVTKKEGFYPEKRTIILFSIPWILFCLINSTLSRNISLSTMQLVSSSSFGFIFILQGAATLIGTLIGGMLADFFGRRLALSISVTLYGIGMALSGLIQNATLAYFAFFAEGLSWGIFLTLYIFVIWGDLSNSENCITVYALGLVPFYIAAAIEPFSNLISQIPLVQSAFLGCTIIFLSNVPLALAPELQSSDFLEKIRLKMHIKAAKKIAKKYEDQR
jgi:hypothetical protein